MQQNSLVSGKAINPYRRISIRYSINMIQPNLTEYNLLGVTDGYIPNVVKQVGICDLNLQNDAHIPHMSV